MTATRLYRRTAIYLAVVVTADLVLTVLDLTGVL